jgi:hypothetical protein
MRLTMVSGSWRTGMNAQVDSRLITNFKRPLNQMHASKGLFAEFS